MGSFVTDRWQALRHLSVAADGSGLPNVEDAVEALVAIESECPECSPVAWGWGEEV